MNSIQKNIKSFFAKKILRGSLLKFIVLIACCCQVAFGVYMKGVSSVFAITPAPPSAVSRKLLAMGDSQLMFRVLALKFQVYGDRFGNYVSLDSYNYKQLGKWFHLLTEMDPMSSFVPITVVNYYSLVKERENVLEIVDYLKWYSRFERATATDGNDRRWRWRALYYAIFFLHSKLNNNIDAVDLGIDMLDRFENIPLWASSLSVAIASKGGKHCAIRYMMNEGIKFDYKMELSLLKLIKKVDKVKHDVKLTLVNRLRNFQDVSMDKCRDIEYDKFLKGRKTKRKEN